MNVCSSSYWEPTVPWGEHECFELRNVLFLQCLNYIWFRPDGTVTKSVLLSPKERQRPDSGLGFPPSSLGWLNLYILTV